MIGKISVGVLISLFVALNTLAFSPRNVVDTTRNSKPKSGGSYILHKVEQGQTLYAVMRLYKTTIAALRAANPGMNENLVVGQVVKVPVGGSTIQSAPVIVKAEPKPTTPEVKPEPKPEVKIEPKVEPKPEPKKVVVEDPVQRKIEEKAKTELAEDESKKAELESKKVEEKPAEPATSTRMGYHKVDAKQSLYSIAVKYGVLMADIRRWNNLSSDQLRQGQELIISEHSYQDYLRRAKLDSSKLSENKKPAVDKANLPPVESSTNSHLPETKITNLGKRTIETGIAEVIDVGDAGNKYLALHRTAAVGSLVQVKNTTNSQSIWVKVIGKLPDIDANRRIIIKLSAKAYGKLSPTGNQFRAEISYLSE